MPRACDVFREFPRSHDSAWVDGKADSIAKLLGGVPRKKKMPYELVDIVCGAPVELLGLAVGVFAGSKTKINDLDVGSVWVDEKISRVQIVVDNLLNKCYVRKIKIKRLGKCTGKKP